MLLSLMTFSITACQTKKKKLDIEFEFINDRACLYLDDLIEINEKIVRCESSGN